jgi:hypothetical protein
MNSKSFSFLVVCLSLAFSRQVFAKVDLPISNNSGLYFLENKGQLSDQNGKKRTDIQFTVQAPGLNIFIGKGQLHYQFTRLSLNERPQDANAGELPADKYGIARLQGTFHTYRLDVELLGANTNAEVISQEQQPYYEAYYLPDCPRGAVAHTFKKVTYKNVYPDIDWVIYTKGDKLEHEFIVGPHGDASKIKLKYSGHTSLKIGKDGGITATTPMGVIDEQAPVCFLANGEKTPSAFKLVGDVLTYDLKGYSGPVLIDPILRWGTYYGPDTSTSSFYTVACHSKYIYTTGLTWANANIATSGVHLSTFGGGATDAYLVKFDSSGARLWATYYGGNGGDWAMAIACDTSGNVYIGGNTGSAAGISTAGATQMAYGGGAWDCFLAKFNDAGALTWGTYIGGSGASYLYGVACDEFGHVYACGDSNDPNNISTAGTFQPVKAGGWDGFLIQYDLAGARQWGTYFGGPSNEFGSVLATFADRVYVAGWTPSTTGIITAGTIHQATLAGTNDMYVMKLTDGGTRLWGSYYGGNGVESTGGIACDKVGGIYLFGSTSSTTGIATAGAAQPAYGGGTSDAFLFRLEPENGLRLWGTYHGGMGDETVTYSRIAADDSLRAFFAGSTTSPTGMATPDAHQNFFAGGDNDAFIAMYNALGTRVWGTYYGGSGRDDARGCAFAQRALYVCGQTTSVDKIATPDGFLPTGGSPSGLFSQGFLVKFAVDTAALPPVDTTTPTDTTLLVGNFNGSASPISIMPNPNNGSFTLSGMLYGMDGAAHITISNVTGRVIAREEAVIRNEAINKQISLGESAPPGIYILSVATKERVLIMKLLKE